ncbi:MAG: DUF192 domain-containing protein [Acidovorax sp.]|nr:MULTISPECIES: DUF192 domain-containing protein [Diaphorobacter]PZU42191.1 MAG: DUF192 domain-containing protein [Acidovorax sp.]QJY34930.1 DUF192 domain-containing protein [Diaphorobacter sp. JS3050]QPN32982.1 DUF192 domain-containing protein [Diaphorobacter sp. JS3051]QYY27383.1 DUF192 domain-containing protein [Diaphorobacter sp. MNS-0]
MPMFSLTAPAMPIARLLRSFLSPLLAYGVALGLCAAAAAQGVPQMNLPRVELQAGMHRIDAQVATAPQERQVGLMHRRDMPMHEGMLFVFEQPATQCFWMRNTLLPLTAAFVADDGTIVNLVDMQPLSEESHCSKRPVRFVLEMNQGWFAKRGLKAGSRLSGRPFTQR